MKTDARLYKAMNKYLAALRLCKFVQLTEEQAADIAAKIEAAADAMIESSK